MSSELGARASMALKGLFIFFKGLVIFCCLQEQLIFLNHSEFNFVG